MSTSPGRWNVFIRRLGWIAIVFLLQITLIVWLSDGSTASVRKPSPAPALSMVSPASAEVVALNDPTLFALPHYQSFSGPAWLRAHPAPNRSFEWSDEPHWIEPSANDFVADTNTRGPDLQAYEVVKTSLPPPPLPMVSVPPQFPDKSALKIQGCTRKLVSTLALPSWTTTNLLTNTVVRLMVDANGLTRSQTILVRSGLPEADEFALKTSRTLRFEPAGAPLAAHNPMSGMTWGQAVFEWHGASPGGPR